MRERESEQIGSVSGENEREELEGEREMGK